MWQRQDGQDFVLLDADYNVIDRQEGRSFRNYPSAKLSVHSVYHTGTNFIAKLLRKAGWMSVGACHWVAVPKDEGFVISPIRDPWATYVTWQSRGRTEDFYGLWERFNRAYENNPELMICPVDTDDRQVYLDALSEKIHCELPTDWSPVESGPRKSVGWVDLSDVYNLPVVKRFGYEQKSPAG